MMKDSITHKHIAILDFGSQYTHLISRRLRDARVFSKIYPHDTPAKTLASERPIGVILSGGPKSVYEADAPSYDAELFELGIPILGICYGQQLISRHFGGYVEQGEMREYGFAKFKIKIEKSKLFHDIADVLDVWMSHGDIVTKLPAGFTVTGATKNCPIAAMADTQRNIYGLQFHPEVHHTKDDDNILRNFAFKICKAEKDWQIGDIIGDILTEIKIHVRTKKVFMLVSGGVDSTVAFALLQKALGEKNVIGVHIDSGLMRKDESQKILSDLNNAGLTNINRVDAEDRFLKQLKNIRDPEEKRVIIGETYMDAAEAWLSENQGDILQSEKWLIGQGTIYPDTIESGGTLKADKIKTHHNRVQRILTMIERGKIIEPLKNIYKEEVREIGANLGLPKKLLSRHPFPGPGLAVMIMCSQARLYIPKIALPKDTTILPIQSTGIQGDNRTYAYPLAVWKTWNFERMSRFATEFTNHHKKINRVVQVVWAKKNQEEKTHPNFSHTPGLFVTKDRLELLQKIHERVTRIVKDERLYDKIWEFPIILLPIGLTKNGQSVVLRPISSKEAMTVNAYSLPRATVQSIVYAIRQFDEIEAIFYDVTDKPPATIQWE